MSGTTTTNPTRELAAIMFSDIVGYTAIMPVEVHQRGVCAKPGADDSWSLSG